MNPRATTLFALALALGGPLPNAFGQGTARAQPEPSDEARVAMLGSASNAESNLALHDLLHRRPIETLAPLFAALESPNPRLRFAAARVLQDDRRTRPTPKLLEVSVDGLRHDDLPGVEVDGVRSAIANAAGYRWLIQHAKAARPLLVTALGSDDLQQRFLAAVVLADSGEAREELERVAKVLIPHLRDNQIAGDAMMAGCAIYQLGPAVLGHLRDARLGADTQQKMLIDLLVFDLTNPPKNNQDIEKRKGMQTVWIDFIDPFPTWRATHLSIQWRGKLTEARRDTPGPLEVRTDHEAAEQCGTFDEVTVAVRGRVVEEPGGERFLVAEGLRLAVAAENTVQLKRGSRVRAVGILRFNDERHRRVELLTRETSPDADPRVPPAP